LATASERLLKKVEDLGCKAIMFTVDAAVSGFRTMDVKAKGVVEQVRLLFILHVRRYTDQALCNAGLQAPPSAKDDKNKSAAPVGIAQAISGYQDDNLVWDDIDFIRVSFPFQCLLSRCLCCYRKTQSCRYW
jgi:L-lactate dehydrogenase (cytochrome)